MSVMPRRRDAGPTSLVGLRHDSLLVSSTGGVFAGNPNPVRHGDCLLSTTFDGGIWEDPFLQVHYALATKTEGLGRIKKRQAGRFQKKELAIIVPNRIAEIPEYHLFRNDAIGVLGRSFPEFSKNSA